MRLDEVKALSGWLAKHVDEGWSGFVINIMFRELHKSSQANVAVMMDEVDRIYRLILLDTLKYPASTPQEKLPILVAVPAHHVFKRDKVSFRDVAPNSGLHIDAFALLPPETRLKRNFEDHIKREPTQARYCGTSRRVVRVDARWVHETPEMAADYALKWLKRESGQFEGWSIWPRAPSEFTQNRRAHGSLHDSSDERR